MPKLSVQFELETPNAQQQGQKAGAAFGAGFSQAVLNANRDLIAKLNQGVIRPPLEAGGPRGILKLLNLVQTSNVDPVTKGLRDITGKDLSKVFSMGAFGANVIKGLRDVTGHDLAKISALPDINSFSGGRMKNLLLGIGAAPFSSWIGARMLSSAAFGSGGGGGGHGLLGAGGASGFAEFFIGIEALKKAFEYGAEKIKEVVERGFNLYVKAHQLRQSVGNLFDLQEAGQQVGLSQSDIDKFLLRNQWGKARTSLQNFGVFSQLGGLSKDFQDAYKWASEIQNKWQDTSRTSYEIQVNFDRIKTDWLTMWNDSNFLKGIDMLTKWTDAALHWSAKQPTGGWFSQLLTATTPIAMIGSLFGKKAGTAQTPDNAPLFQLPRQLPQMSQFEKMGFNIGGGRVTDKLDRANTLLQGILGAVEGMAKFYVNLYNANIPGASGGLINVP